MSADWYSEAGRLWLAGSYSGAEDAFTRTFLQRCKRGGLGAPHFRTAAFQSPLRLQSLPLSNKLSSRPAEKRRNPLTPGAPTIPPDEPLPHQYERPVTATLT